jgi:amidase
MENGSAAVAGFIPSRDATVVRRLLNAGATITGKSVCEDLCFSGASFTSWREPVCNPWDRTRDAGGSSSGSAALVAGGEVDLAVGGDQGGSIRIPASFCGIVGHKPTHGLVPYTGAFPIESTIDHLGPMTRTVADTALMLGVLAGPDGFDPRQPSHLQPVDYVAELSKPVAGLRIGVLREGFASPGSMVGVDNIVRAVVERLASRGLPTEEVSVPWHLDAKHVWDVIATEGTTFQMLDGNGYGMNSWGLYDDELIAHFARERLERAASLSTTVKVTAMTGRYSFETGCGTYYAKARNLAYEVRAAYDAALVNHDVLVMPTTPFTARELPVVADLSVAEYLECALSMLTNTAAFDVTGHPAISVPAGLLDGLPVGMMIVGRRFDDATVLRVAHAVEQLAGEFPRPTVDLNVAAWSASSDR